MIDLMYGGGDKPELSLGMLYVPKYGLAMLIFDD